MSLKRNDVWSGVLYANIPRGLVVGRAKSQKLKKEKNAGNFKDPKQINMISSFVVPITHFLGSQTDNVKILFPSTCIGTDGIAHVMSCSRLAPTLI